MKRRTVISLSVCILVLLVVGLFTGTYARYIRSSGDVENTFSPAISITPTVEETFDGIVKENVHFSVGQTEYPVYVRAAIITWKKNSSSAGIGQPGDIHFTKPVEGAVTDAGNPDDGTPATYSGDYLLDLNLSDWEKRSDGYYYCKTPIPSGDITPVLIKSCRQVNPEHAPEGYSLSVELLVQTVQAVGTTDAENKDAYLDAWREFNP